MDRFNFGVFKLVKSNKKQYQLKPFYLNEIKSNKIVPKEQMRQKTLREKIREFISNSKKSKVYQMVDFVKNQFLIQKYKIRDMEFFFNILFYGQATDFKLLPLKSKRILKKVLEKKYFSKDQVAMVNKNVISLVFKQKKSIN